MCTAKRQACESEKVKRGSLRRAFEALQPVLIYPDLGRGVHPGAGSGTVVSCAPRFTAKPLQPLFQDIQYDDFRKRERETADYPAAGGLLLPTAVELALFPYDNALYHASYPPSKLM